jgi:hypothetical protein
VDLQLRELDGHTIRSLAAAIADTNVAIKRISFGDGTAASCAVVSAATTGGSASFSSTAQDPAHDRSRV